MNELNDRVQELKEMLKEKDSETKQLQERIEELEKLLKEAGGIFDEINGLVKDASRAGIY